METTLNQRVELVMKEMGFSNPNEFATEIGMDRPDILYNVLNGKTAKSPILIDFITKKYRNINQEWLKTGKGEMLKQVDKIQDTLDLYSENRELYKKLEKANDKYEQALMDRIIDKDKINDLLMQVMTLKDEIRKISDDK